MAHTAQRARVAPEPREARKALEAAIRAWWAAEATDWDEAVEGKPKAGKGKTDLWDAIPVVDSKTVARSSPIFEAHLGVRLDIDLIRPGGYATIDEMIADLVPKMLAQIESKGSASRSKEAKK